MHFHATERQKKAHLTDRHLPAASRSPAHQYLCVATIAMVTLYRDSSKKVGAGTRYTSRSVSMHHEVAHVNERIIRGPTKSRNGEMRNGKREMGNGKRETNDPKGIMYNIRTSRLSMLLSLTGVLD